MTAPTRYRALLRAWRKEEDEVSIGSFTGTITALVGMGMISLLTGETTVIEPLLWKETGKP